MSKPVLVVMAAGLGSRFGGAKQVRPVGAHDQALMDYSLYDARRAGVEEAVFIISPAMADSFPDTIRARVGEGLRVRCVVQDIADVPEGFTPPEGRAKPWGTGHAVRACRGQVDAPFAVINADDFYGRSGFQAIYDYLSGGAQSGECAMVGYALSNTLTDNGYVARGICAVDGAGYLQSIREHTHIIASCEGALSTEDQQTYHRLPETALASMNLWGFLPEFLPALDAGFTDFLQNELPENPLRAEYFLPNVVGAMLADGRLRAKVLPCRERWYGITYAEDLPRVTAAIVEMTREGLYPERLK
jgi:hypothetical protein